MSKKATLNATIDPAAVQKEFEKVFATGRKSLQEAFLSGTEAAEKAFKTNAETVKTSYEKAVAEGKSNYEKAVKAFESSHFYDKNSAEAFITAGNAAVEKGEKIGTALLELGTERIQEIFKVAKTLAETEDYAKAVEVQAEFAKTSLQNYVSDVGRFNSLLTEAAKSVFEPFGTRYASALDVFTKQAAA